MRNLRALGPRFFSITGESPSGPSAFEFLDFLIALAVCSTVIITGASVGFLRYFLMVDLDSFLGLVLVPGVYWVLKLFAIFLIY